MITSNTSKYYNWIDDVGPEINKHLNVLLAEEGVDPVKDLHGGYFKDGKWVRVGESSDYRNYWHVYLELFAEGLRNGQYLSTWFPHPDSNEDWNFYYDMADEFCKESRSFIKHTDPHWARNLVTAVRYTLKNNNMVTDPDGEDILFWWSW